jgi:hypothetical protein
MAETFCLQPLGTFRGKLSAAKMGSLNQPRAGWGETGNHRDATFHVQILAHGASGTEKPHLLLETAASPAGPWHELKEYLVSPTAPPPPPAQDAFGAAVGGANGAVSCLERFFRWRSAFRGTWQGMGETVLLGRFV